MANGLATSRGVGQYVASEVHVALHPLRYRPDATRPAILYCHSRGNDAMQAKDIGYLDAQVAALTEAGYLVLSCDLGGTATWGNATAQSRVGSAKTYAQGTLGAKAGKVGLFAASMGAVLALNWTAANPTLVACVGATIPVVDLGYTYTNDVGGYAAEISTAHGGAPGAPVDPMQNTATHAAGPPIKLWYASNDTTAVTARTEAFATAVGATCATSSLGAVGHTPQTTPASEVVAFFRTYL